MHLVSRCISGGARALRFFKLPCTSMPVSNSNTEQLISRQDEHGCGQGKPPTS